MSEIIIDTVNNEGKNEEIKKESSMRLEGNDHSFNQLLSLQLLIQKQNCLKELCK